MKLRHLILIILVSTVVKNSKAQLLLNGNFSSGTASWGCGAETNTEATYGGSGSNAVAEVDAAAGLCQTVSGLTIGNSYFLSFSATRRTGGCPSPAITNVDITVSGGLLATTVTRTNTTFGFTTSGYMFTATSTMHTITFAAGAGFGTSTCGMIIDNVSLTFSPLPIELLNFSGNYLDNAVHFEWTTASEKNNAHFEIERSGNGIDYTTIGTLPSKAPQGNSKAKLDYTGADPQPAPGINYYRLRQVDFDKTTSYSPVIAVNASLAGNLLLYPNPNTGEFTLEGCQGQVNISILNHLGNLVHTQTYNAGDTPKTVHLNVKEKVPAGIYQCIVSSAGGFRSCRFVIDN